MSLRLASKSVTLIRMTLNDVMAVILRYFTEFGKSVFQHITRRSVAKFMHESIVFCSACTISS